MKYTEWFPCTIKPVHIGVYQRDMSFRQPKCYYYSYWNGKYWCFNSNNLKYAAADWSKRYHSEYQDLPWRGLIKEQ